MAVGLSVIDYQTVRFIWNTVVIGLEGSLRVLAGGTIRMRMSTSASGREDIVMDMVKCGTMMALYMSDTGIRVSRKV